MTGLRTFTRRTIADRPMPTATPNARMAHSLRAAFGPGFQTAATERFAQHAARR